MMMEIRGKMVKNASYARYRAQQVLQRVLMHEKIKSANTENIYESFTIQWLPRLSVLWLKKELKMRRMRKMLDPGPEV